MTETFGLVIAVPLILGEYLRDDEAFHRLHAYVVQAWYASLEQHDGFPLPGDPTVEIDEPFISVTGQAIRL